MRVSCLKSFEGSRELGVTSLPSAKAIMQLMLSVQRLVVSI